MRYVLTVVMLVLAPHAQAADPAAENRNAAARGERGPVARMFFAQELYAQGIADRDALVVLAAARMAAAIKVRAATLTPQTSPPAGAVAGEAMPGDRVGAARMLAEARRLAASDEAALSLVDAVEAETPGAQAGGVSEAAGVLAPGQTETWSLPFYSGVLAEVAIVGDGNSGLDVRVADENGNPMCVRLGPGDRAYCDWVPAWNGYFKVVVSNPGDAANGYRLFTN